MIRITNREAFRTQTELWIEKVREGLAKAVTAMAVDAQHHARSISPVYSGDFASNWNVSWGQPNTRFYSSKDDIGGTNADTFRYERFPAPRTSPWGNGEVNMGNYALGHTVYISNSAKHDEPYAWKIENKEIIFRPENKDKGEVAKKTLAYIKNNYGVITKGMML